MLIADDAVIRGGLQAAMKGLHGCSRGGSCSFQIRLIAISPTLASPSPDDRANALIDPNCLKAGFQEEHLPNVNPGHVPTGIKP